MNNLTFIREGNEWIFSDGTILPVVSGGSDLGDLGIPNLDEGNEEFSDFTKGILEQIEEADRPVVQKYLKDWDKSVQEEFTSRAEKLKPWEELGSYEDVTKALGWIGGINDDPIKFYNEYTKSLKEAGLLMDPNDKPDFSNLPEYEGLPEGFVKEFQETKSQLSEAMNTIKTFTQSQEEKEIEQKVDNLMKELHTEHGDFDEDWVLLQMSKGKDPVESVKAFKKDVVEKYSSPRRPPPKIMPGNGAVPNGQVDLSKMTREEKFKYAVTALKTANAAARGEA